jgi:hypothetical protein
MSTVLGSPSPTPSPAKPEEADSPIGSLAKAFDFAIRQREFEISQLTQRNNFFMIFQGVLIAGIVQSQGTAAPLISFCVCLVGFVTSLLQVGMAAGSKFWQIRWERAAKTTEIWLLEELKDYKRVNTFLTADGKFLIAAEKARLGVVNITAARAADPITYIDDSISKSNKEEINQDASSWMRNFENLLILKKFSVSRIPIWAAITLSLFWIFLPIPMVSVNGETLGPMPGFFDLGIVPLKSDAKSVG